MDHDRILNCALAEYEDLIEDVRFIGTWRGYDVYGYTYPNNIVPYTGAPFRVLVKDDEVRMSTTEESYEILAEVDKSPQSPQY